jgi:hypothetical protein
MAAAAAPIPPPVAALATIVDRYSDVWFGAKADDYSRLLLQFDPTSAQSPGTPAGVDPTRTR